MVEAALSQIVEYQSSLMATTILHDAESQRWSDMRPFYEDERISHCIQMWWYYLQGLRHDLWSSLPPKAGRSVFAAVFDKVSTYFILGNLHRIKDTTVVAIGKFTSPIL